VIAQAAELIPAAQRYLASVYNSPCLLCSLSHGHRIAASAQWNQVSLNIAPKLESVSQFLDCGILCSWFIWIRVRLHLVVLNNITCLKLQSSFYKIKRNAYLFKEALLEFYVPCSMLYIKLYIFRDKVFLCYPDWLQTSGLKQFSCLSLLRAWDHRHAPSRPASM
jgi:hypothetical protein